MKAKRNASSFFLGAIFGAKVGMAPLFPAAPTLAGFQNLPYFLCILPQFNIVTIPANRVVIRAVNYQNSLVDILRATYFIYSEYESTTRRRTEKCMYKQDRVIRPFSFGSCRIDQALIKCRKGQGLGMIHRNRE